MLHPKTNKIYKMKKKLNQAINKINSKMKNLINKNKNNNYRNKLTLIIKIQIKMKI